jgi:dTDP-glucose 4,6-dehydratase
VKLLVCGGAGFIGSNFVRRRLAVTDDSIVVLDKLTYAGNRLNLAPIEDEPTMASRLRFVVGDIADASVVDELVRDADSVINFAAESHVDRSIADSAAFVRTGVVGVQVLLEAVRRHSSTGARRLVQVSTDEVYGAVESGSSVETDGLAPRSPYAAAKAAGELLVRSYVITHGVDAVITRGSNTYGPFQHPEKLIPLFITNALEDRPLPLYGDGAQERDWLHVDDHADAVAFVLEQGQSGEAYNVCRGDLRTNRDVTERILSVTGKPWSLVRSVPDRPGHDRRYALDGSKLARAGWTATIGFDEGLEQTIAWFEANRDWWTAVRSGEWLDYYEHQYGWRLAASTPA